MSYKFYNIVTDSKIQNLYLLNNYNLDSNSQCLNLLFVKWQDLYLCQLFSEESFKK